MSFQRNRAFGLAVLAGVLTLGASQMKAEVYKATFDLPVEAYWGSAVLAPGEYTVEVQRGATTPLIRVNEDNKQIATILPGPSMFQDGSTPGKLTLVQINGSYVVKSFDAGLMNKTFAFSTPKAVSSRQANAKETSRITIMAAATR